MSEHIKVGDLVAVVYPSECSAGDTRIGHTFFVKQIDHIQQHDICSNCGREHKDRYGLLIADDGNDWWPSYRLQRIDPPPIEQSIETREPTLADGRAG